MREDGMHQLFLRGFEVHGHDKSLNELSYLGADEMRGGAGNDTFIVGAGDTVIEFKNEGYDTVTTDLATYKLGANLEALHFTGNSKWSVLCEALKSGPVEVYPVRHVLHQEEVPCRVFWTA